MTILKTTMTKSQAQSLLRENNKVSKAVIYLKKLDKEMIYRMGKKNDNRITRVRHHEDDRPMTQVNKRTKQIISKRSEIITYGENNKLHVLEKSGGVSLFDAMSTKLKLNKNDCWYFLPKNAKIPKEIIIAKDVEPDAHGHFHYSLQPAYNMLMSIFKEKLAEIGDQLRTV